MEVVLENQVLNITADVDNVFDVTVAENNAEIINAGPVAFIDQNAMDEIAAHAADTNAHITSADRIAIETIGSKAPLDHNHNSVYEAKNTNIQEHIADTSVHVDSTDKDKIDSIVINGTGTKFHSDNGTYQAVSTVSSFNELSGVPADNVALAIVLSDKAPLSHNHALASLTEKSYNSLSDKPTIPTVPSALSGFINDLTAYYSKTETYTQTEINSMIGDIETLLAAL